MFLKNYGLLRFLKPTDEEVLVSLKLKIRNKVLMHTKPDIQTNTYFSFYINIDYLYK